MLRIMAPPGRIAIMILMFLPFAGCVSPSGKIATSLIAYGFEGNQAQCVGERLQSNLSTAQLRQLERAARAFSLRKPRPDLLTVLDLLQVASQIDDLRVAIETGKAAARCGAINSTLLDD